MNFDGLNFRHELRMEASTAEILDCYTIVRSSCLAHRTEMVAVEEKWRRSWPSRISRRWSNPTSPGLWNWCLLGWSIAWKRGTWVIFRWWPVKKQLASYPRLSRFNVSGPLLSHFLDYTSGCVPGPHQELLIIAVASGIPPKRLKTSGVSAKWQNSARSNPWIEWRNPPDSQAPRGRDSAIHHPLFGNIVNRSIVTNSDYNGTLKTRDLNWFKSQGLDWR